jgi:hypothetical protein
VSARRGLYNRGVRRNVRMARQGDAWRYDEDHVGHVPKVRCAPLAPPLRPPCAPVCITFKNLLVSSTDSHLKFKMPPPLPTLPPTASRTVQYCPPPQRCSSRGLGSLPYLNASTAQGAANREMTFGSVDHFSGDKQLGFGDQRVPLEQAALQPWGGGAWKVPPPRAFVLIGQAASFTPY